MVDFENIKQEVKENKVFWILILLIMFSIFLYCIKIPSREIYVLASFIALAVCVTFKYIK